MNKTPNTRRVLKDDKIKKEMHKLGYFQTFMTLFKGFIISSPIYTPKAFVNGGWLISSIMQVFSACFTLYCAILLLEINKKTGLSNYAKIGEHTYGKVGKIYTEVVLWVTQVGFCCAYVFFIKENVHSILMEAFEIDVKTEYIAIACWIMFTMLCYVRKIEKFAVTHIFADAMIVITLVIVMVYGVKNIGENGSQLKTIYALNPETWSSAIGFSVFSYEGIGTVLPIAEITKHPEAYNKIIVACLVSSCMIFLVFGNFCCIAWGDELTTPLITDVLSFGENPKWIGWVVKGLFMTNLMFSYPLILYPAIMINENYLFDGWAKT